jgi:hypothetical protein
MKNLKDKVTNICAWITGVGGVIIGAHLSGQIMLPTWAVSILGTLIGIAVVATQILTGKAPDGTTKTPEQIIQQNTKG